MLPEQAIPGKKCLLYGLIPLAAGLALAALAETYGPVRFLQYPGAAIAIAGKIALIIGGVLVALSRGYSWEWGLLTVLTPLLPDRHPERRAQLGTTNEQEEEHSPASHQ